MLLKHVNDLLDMSKVEARKLKLELHDSDVAALVRFLASHFAVLAADRGIEYTVDADGPCVAAIDPDKLQRVVMNLLGNAFKFVPDGGRIRCSLRHSAAELTIAVDDSGPGIRPELRQAIFERFRQGDGGMSRTVAGTGLGLAIAKEFVEMHKGRIDVLDSSLGGARFEVRLPMGRIGAEAPVTETRLDQLLLDGVLEELRFTGIKPKEAAAERALAAGGAAARAGRRGQPGHESLRRGVPGPRLRRGDGVRRPRGDRAGTPIRSDGDRLGHHDAARERRRDGRGDAGAAGAAAHADPAALG